MTDSDIITEEGEEISLWNEHGGLTGFLSSLFKDAWWILLMAIVAFIIATILMRYGITL